MATTETHNTHTKAITYKFDEKNLYFIKNTINKQINYKEFLNFNSEDLYWLEKDIILLEDTPNFLATASTWEKRFNGFIAIEKPLERVFRIQILEMPKLGEDTLEVKELFNKDLELVNCLLLSIDWHHSIEEIKELYSPLGFVLVGTKLYAGVSPEYLSVDLHQSGKKLFSGERLQKFLQQEWDLLSQFIDIQCDSLKTLLVNSSNISLEYKDSDENTFLLQVGDKKASLNEIPTVFKRFSLVDLSNFALRGTQIFDVGLRPFYRYFTGEKLSELTTINEKYKDRSQDMVRITKPDSWYYNVGFLAQDSSSDIYLAGDNDFTYLARQLILPDSSKPEILSVVRGLKDAINGDTDDISFKDYVQWRDSFVKDRASGKPLYALIFMQEIINELFACSREEKHNMFWSLWQSVAQCGNRELKGKFIEAAIDWSLIDRYMGVYGYMSTLKNGYIHNALLWHAFLPENRDTLDADLCIELAGEYLTADVLTEVPSLKHVISKVFGVIDDYYRSITGATFLASFHPPFYGIKRYVPYKDQIYAGFVGEVIVAEITPAVFHKPLIAFTKSVICLVRQLLAKEDHSDIDLPKPIVQLVKEVVSIAYNTKAEA